ncbi:MAG: nicotinate-nucleotide--dimethylbenzimidazole phosphoribosyltransferase [Caldisericia bacterium]|nr:nicotinate-nucleotide--dimethylbenzimidazole phosphoribosyltransferase [Caldisericia bacterium]
MVFMFLPQIPGIYRNTISQAQKHLDSLTKPLGSLGRLEELAARLAGMTGRVIPDFSRKTVVVMAADHGVASEGVSAYPPDVTFQMVLNFLSGGAAINVLARHAKAEVKVVDMGVRGEFPANPNLINKKIACGTANFLKGPAMTLAQAQTAVESGIQVAKDLAGQGCQMVATGDMGIGNTTASSAIVSVLTGLPVEAVTGRGTGVDDAGLKRKIQVIEQAIEINKPNPKDAINVLSKVGGFEIAGLCGLAIGCASLRIPVIIDGFISGAAALVAARLVPDVESYLIASHKSVECGHAAVFEELGLKPLLDLDLRLGEGTGAVLAFNLVDASLAIMREMATFESANVSGKL